MNIALILSGGTGMRLGTDIPKQYIEVCGRPVISYCVERLAAHNRIDALQIVADGQWHELILDCLEKYDCPGQDGNKKFRGFSQSGETRQLSVYHGLEDISQYASGRDVVIVHDAARPFVLTQMITDSLEALEGHDGVLPALPMKDTVYRSTDGRKVSALLDRSEIFAGQAPETFRLGRYLEANRRLLPERIHAVSGSAEAAVMAGLDIVIIPGDERNFKITTREDMERFCRIIRRQDFSD